MPRVLMYLCLLDQDGGCLLQKMKEFFLGMGCLFRFECIHLDMKILK